MGRSIFTLCSLLVAGLASASLGGCSGAGNEERPPRIEGTFGSGPPQPECEAPKEPDLDSACGAETRSLFGRKPTVYFVLDVSGSMLDFIPEGGDTKLDAAKSALNSVVREIGHRSKYGLTTFPGENTPESTFPNNCAAGDEIFPVSEGDDLTCVNLPPNGPVYTSFVRKLSRAAAGGGTPLSPTLEKVRNSLTEREDQATVILITDGSPNCNDSITCGPELCEPSRNGWPAIGADGHPLICDEETNCCDPEVVDKPDAHLGCIEQDPAVEQLELLRRSGIFTYVVGVLGTEDFDDVMNSLAEAGGRPRQGTRKYFDVNSLAELTQTVRTIGLNVTQSCEIELVDPPPFANELNVYFDGEVVAADEDDGWTLSDDVVTLQGESCEEMKSGKVQEVQLISGCATIIR